VNMPSCAGKTYPEIWEIFKTHHGDSPDTRRIHLKWKLLGIQAHQDGRRRAT